MYTVRTLFKKAMSVLKEANSGTPALDAEVLMMHFLHMDRVKFMMNMEMEISPKDADKILGAIEARRKGKPVQYITGHQEFMSLDLYVDEGVLIPRGDTEVSALRAIDLLKGKKNPVLIDMCTGSGAIAVAVAYYIEDAICYACDISKDAILCCKKNIDRYNLSSRVNCVETDLFSSLHTDIVADIIISNPPYIETDEIENLMAGVKDYEPKIALDGGRDGLDFYRRITKSAGQYLGDTGILIYEIGGNQGQEVKTILQENSYENIQIERDLANLDRCIYGTKQSEGDMKC